MERQAILNIDNSEQLEPYTGTVADAALNFKDGVLRRVGIAQKGYVNLIFEIIHQAATDGDSDYFLGHKFKYHCYLLGVDHEDLLEVIVRKGLSSRSIRRKSRPNGILVLRDEIREKYSSGNYTQEMLSKEYATSQQNISLCVKGIKSTYRINKSPTLTQDIITDRLQGHTIKVIARKFKVDNAKVVAILKPLGMNKKQPTKNKYHLGG